MSSATEIVGYKADADLWCPECAQGKYGKPPEGAGAPGPQENQEPAGRTDGEKKEIPAGTPDREGNEVFPVFGGTSSIGSPRAGGAGRNSRAARSRSRA